MTVKIGLLGLSHWYFAIGTGYHVCLHPDAELVALADPDTQLAEKVARTYRVKNVYSDYAELIHDPAVDAVIISTTTRLQPQVTCAAARAKKHMMICKPIARTLEEADEVIQTVEDEGVVIAASASYPIETDPVKHLIETGAIGVPYAVHQATYAIEPYASPGNSDPGWFINPYEAAGGAFIDHAVYDVAYARWYLEDEVTSVRGVMRNVSHPAWEVEDYGFAELQFARGGIATIECTFTERNRTRFKRSILGTAGRIEQLDDQVYIYTDSNGEMSGRKVMWLEGENPVLNDYFLDPGIPEPPFASHRGPLLYEFINCINSNEKSRANGFQAKENLAICLAAYLSNFTGKRVELPLRACPDFTELMAPLIQFKGISR